MDIFGRDKPYTDEQLNTFTGSLILMLMDGASTKTCEAALYGDREQKIAKLNEMLGAPELVISTKGSYASFEYIYSLPKNRKEFLISFYNNDYSI